jgi:hypothetical protein
MKKLGSTILGSTLLALCFLACGSDVDGGSSGDPPGPSLDVSPSISACGGFLGDGSGAKIPPPPTPYCDAERLLWNYDAATRTLGLLNSRMQLNCCGQHSIAVTLEGNVHVVTETDAPEKLSDGSEARCGCMCVFDYAADVSPVEMSTISMRIVRNVTDQNPAVTVVWEGMLDLSEVSGTVVTSTQSAENWCTEPPP